jgi:alpha-D-glucose phosphate-specific phosphoglucomutase
MIPDIKFGTDGWRAVIARDFTFATVRTVAQGIANYITSNNLNKKGIVLGYDNRFLSEDFARDCAKVLVGNGIKVYMSFKAMPTPVTAFAVRFLDAGGAVMITASHNPPQYNGIKFIPAYAGPAMPDVTAAIESAINRVQESGRIYELDLEEARQFDLLKDIDIEKDYINHLIKLIQPEHFTDRKLKVVVDPMYGAGIGYLDRILGELGCEVKTVNNYRDVLFGGQLPEPTSRNLAALSRSVVNSEADIGLALDGDADRFGIVDNKGDFVTPNRFMYLLLNHLIKTRTFRGPICRSVATTHMLDRVARQNGLSIIETPVGFKYIGECLREKGCMLGGEESGGLSIYGHIPEKDGILAGLLAVEMLAVTGRDIPGISEEFAAQYGDMVSERLDITTRPQDKDAVSEKIADFNPRQIAGLKVIETDDMEGRKLELEDGSWVLIRSSGTEPVFRVYAETYSAQMLKNIQKDVLDNLGL